MTTIGEIFQNQLVDFEEEYDRISESINQSVDEQQKSSLKHYLGLLKKCLLSIGVSSAGIGLIALFVNNKETIVKGANGDILGTAIVTPGLALLVGGALNTLRLVKDDAVFYTGEDSNRKGYFGWRNVIQAKRWDLQEEHAALDNKKSLLGALLLYNEQNVEMVSDVFDRQVDEQEQQIVTRLLQHPYISPYIAFAAIQSISPRRSINRLSSFLDGVNRGQINYEQINNLDDAAYALIEEAVQRTPQASTTATDSISRYDSSNAEPSTLGDNKGYVRHYRAKGNRHRPA